MNYLAHLVLADNTPESLVGNLAGDFVGGLGLGEVHPSLRPGVERHRAVDRFTDSHPVTARSRARLQARWRLFSGVLVDVFYDHFLARDFERLAGEPLARFAGRVYAALQSQAAVLPPRLAKAAPVMIRHDWLAAYAELDGVAVILGRMARRTRRGAELARAAEDLRDHYAALAADFNEFFPQLWQQFRPDTGPAGIRAPF
ncbi:MAG: DUF479 domain-containing protein [Planctomycetes bacterium]|jgi:acyl carrier protein phosphodiesterase|nr:DUF479 domain-containing protein [Planctomycetota bacterium]MCL4732136.1 DUF479 domain-containing protein [Planctomycetota bacterium]